MEKLVKQLSRHSALFCLALLILFAVIVRVLLSLADWPSTNSDEATFHLMALHIAQHGEHPIFMDGQTYMGASEAYIGAVLFKFFGPSAAAIRIGVIGLFACFLVCLYLLTSRLYSKRFALITIAFLSIGSEPMLVHQIQSTGGNAEINILAVLSLLLAYLIASQRDRDAHWLQRAALYGLWGIVAGMGLWSDILIAPYLLFAGLLLVVFCWRECVSWAVIAVLIGAVLGGWPLLYYNLTAAQGLDTFSTFIHLSTMGTPAYDPLWQHIQNTVLVSLPIMTGLRPINLLQAWPAPSAQLHPFRYLLLQSGWSVAYCGLLLISLILALLALRQIRRNAHLSTEDKRQEQVRQVARLMLVLSAVLTLCLYIKGSAPIINAYLSARYLTVLWISTPAVLWPIWHLVRVASFKPLSQILRTSLLVLRLCLLLAVFVIIGISMLNILPEIAQAQDGQQHEMRLVAELESLHISRFYTDYWTCNRLIFAAQERLICAVEQADGDHLVDGYNRYASYLDIVRSSPSPGYVFPAGAPEIPIVESMLNSNQIAYHLAKFNGYSIYQLVA